MYMCLFKVQTTFPISIYFAGTVRMIHPLVVGNVRIDVLWLQKAIHCWKNRSTFIKVLCGILYTCAIQL